jgi:3-oxoacyl-[acyl-carrier protein] reductase
MPTGEKKLAGKVAVVTGASKGIGAAIARHLADAGASVVVNYASSKAGADRVVAAITAAGGRAVAIQADVSKQDEIRRLFTETRKTFDRLDVLVNNAGVYDFAPIEEVTAEMYHRMFNLNVLGLILASQEAVRHFAATGGSIINIGSVAGKLALPGGSVYCATKAAVDAVTRCLASELGPRNIRVNAVNPGMVETEGVKAKSLDSGEFKQQQVVQTPLGRIAVPDDIAPAVVFLASPESGWITGESLYLTGGLR